MSFVQLPTHLIPLPSFCAVDLNLPTVLIVAIVGISNGFFSEKYFCLKVWRVSNTNTDENSGAGTLKATREADRSRRGEHSARLVHGTLTVSTGFALSGAREGPMALNHVDDVEPARARGQMRVLATTMKQIEAQAIMARLAEHYDNLADRAELRANGE